ncbi:hypothetical protein LguiA_015576 [Lonicera macranthoides]
MSFVRHRVFDKPTDCFIHANQISDIFNHRGVDDPPWIRHPKVAHVLLGHTPNTTSFIKRTPTEH